MKKKSTQDFYSKWFIAPAAILFIIFFVVPNLASFVLGFTDWSLYDFNNIKFNGLENFRRLFSEKTFAIAIKNTFYFAIVTVLIKNVFGFLMALIVKKTSKFNTLLRAVVFLPMTISVMSLPLFLFLFTILQMELSMKDSGQSGWTALLVTGFLMQDIL